MSFLNKFKTAPYKPEIKDTQKVDTLYSHWRFRVFYSMYIGYALYYLTRKSFTFAVPTLALNLGLDKGHIGLLASIFAMAYGTSKFFSGILGDRSNPRFLLPIGLILTGLCNIFFGFASSFILLCIFWGLNGWFQGFGWPACARLLTHWYSHSERGRWWSMWNTSHNVGGALIPLFVGFCAYHYGWRAAMILPGIFVIIGAFILINRLTDTPQSHGLPSIEKFRSDYPDNQNKEPEHEITAKEILTKYVLTNPFIWLLGISYFFVYIIRTAVNDWTVLYLVEQKGYNPLTAGGVIFWFEIGGIAGSLLAGWSSDKIFSGNRGPVNVLYCLFTTFTVYLFWQIAGTTPFLDSLLVFAIGFLIFGPQMLIGIAAAELSHKKAAATATGLIGWIAYFGAATAGWPLGKIIHIHGWDGYFGTLTACALISTLLLFPLWSAKTTKEKTLPKESTT